MNSLFIEKYRPKTLEDLILPKYMYEKFINFIKCKKIPNMIITGPPGTGKTSTVLCLAKSLYNNNNNIIKDVVLELNASNNRTLEYINVKINYFCKRKVDNASYKFIILDEADNITKKTQNLLVNLIEEYKDTIFTFTCNDKTKIVESIQSRCLIIYYNPLISENISDRLIYICNNEGIKYEMNGIKTLEFISQGDIRQAINNLEVIYYNNSIITEDYVYKIAYQPHKKIIIKIIENCVHMKLLDIIEDINNLKDLGYCSNDIILTLVNYLKIIDIDEDIRINFIKIISQTYIYICNGIDTNLQLYSCISRLIKYIYNSNKN